MPCNIQGREVADRQTFSTLSRLLRHAGVKKPTNTLFSRPKSPWDNPEGCLKDFFIIHVRKLAL